VSRAGFEPGQEVTSMIIPFCTSKSLILVGGVIMDGNLRRQLEEILEKAEATDRA